MIEVKNLTKHFGDNVVLSSTSLSIEDRQIVCLVGPDGAGRSTLLGLLAGVLKADAGTIVMDDMPVYDNTNTKKHIFYIPADPYFFLGAKAQDIAELYKRVYPFFNMDRFGKLIQDIGLKPDTKVNKLSLTMKRIFMLVCGVCAEPKYLLCDELADGLNETETQFFEGIISQELNKGYITIVLATSDMDNINKIFTEDMEDIGYELRVFALGDD